MIHYTCDICGDPMPDAYRRPSKAGNLTQLCGVRDVCKCCADAGGKMDVQAVLLAAWQDLARAFRGEGAAEVLREHDAQEEGAEKRRILAHMTAFRDNNKLGCWSAVAKLAGAGVTEDLLRDMLNGTVSPTIDVWRRVGRALDKLDPPKEARDAG